MSRWTWGLPGIVVLGRDPVERGAQILFGPLHHFAGVVLELAHLAPYSGETISRKWWRSPSQRSTKAAAIGQIELAVEHLHPLAVAGGAVALDIKRMAHHAAGRAAACLGVHHHARLDDDALAARRALMRELHIAGAGLAREPGRPRALVSGVSASPWETAQG